MRFNIKTFGCQMNVCDSNWLSLALRNRGWQEVSEEEANVIVVNTCSVREKPEQKVYSLLGRLKRYQDKKNPFFVAVGGCVAQQVGEDFWKSFPCVRLVFGTDGIVSVPEALDRLVQDSKLRLSLLDFKDYYPEREKVPWMLNKYQAFVNIMQGCDNFCAYCIVPYTRGRQKSRRSDRIIKECQELVRSGVREITLLGQNVNSYGQDKFGDGMSFADLVHQVCSIPGLTRVRFTTSHPKDISPELIKAFGQLDNLCPGLHLPLQSGSDRILKRMGRKYTREGYLQIVKQLRRVCPEIVLTTDLIVGFPGEQEEDFQATLSTMEEIEFDSCFSFKYSDRPGVRAAQLSNKVPEQIKKDRLQSLQEVQDKLTSKSLHHMLGKEFEVLVEGLSPKKYYKRGSWFGREPGGRIVHFPYETSQDLSGKLILVKIKEAKKHSVVGEVIKEPW